jgi:hypothetical protein
MHEGLSCIVPAELEAGGERGDPDFADGRVGRNHELGLLGLFKNNFELSAFAFDVEAVLIAEDEQALLEILERGIRFALKVFFVEHEFSVHEESERWVVGSESRRRGYPTPPVFLRTSSESIENTKVMFFVNAKESVRV